MSQYFKAWFQLSHISAGFIAVIVGYTSSAAIVFQAANATGASSTEIASWLWALGIGMGISCLGLSYYYRSPILTAWSTPGAALLATGLSGLPMSEAIGIFLFSSALITLSGITGWFERIANIVPKSLGTAMLAGILLRFGVEIFISLPENSVLVGLMLVFFLLARRFASRYAVPISFLFGLCLAYTQGAMQLAEVQLSLAQPIFMLPTFSLSTLIGLGLPLFIITMTSQNLPGLTMLRANGYQTPASPLMSWTGLTGMLLAPFGGFSFNLAAISAAVCMGKEADADPTQRYRSAMWAGVFYLVTGLLGASIVSLFTVFPPVLVSTIAGLALLGTISHCLADAMAVEKEREAALISFLVTASGLSFLGIGSAFWGLVLGLSTTAIYRRHQ